jgi:hypothetical protein
MCFVLAYYVAFGPHGSCVPVNPPGTTVKILTGISALIGAVGLLYVGFCTIGTLSILPVYNNVKFFLSHKKIRHSPTATQDDHQGVGRGQQRARQGA